MDDCVHDFVYDWARLWVTRILLWYYLWATHSDVTTRCSNRSSGIGCAQRLHGSSFDEGTDSRWLASKRAGQRHLARSTDGRRTACRRARTNKTPQRPIRTGGVSNPTVNARTCLPVPTFAPLDQEDLAMRRTALLALPLMALHVAFAAPAQAEESVDSSDGSIAIFAVRRLKTFPKDRFPTDSSTAATTAARCA